MDKQTVVGLFENSKDADNALTEFLKVVERSSVSILARETTLEEMRVEDLSAANADAVAAGAEGGAAGGAAIGGLAGLIAGVSALVIPGIGPVITAGTIAATLGSTAVGAGVGAAAGGVIGALIGLGVPEDEANIYAQGVDRGGVLLAVEHNSDQHDQIVQIFVRNDALDIDSARENWNEDESGTSSDSQNEPTML